MVLNERTGTPGNVTQIQQNSLNEEHEIVKKKNKTHRSQWEFQKCSDATALKIEISEMPCTEQKRKPRRNRIRT